MKYWNLMLNADAAPSGGAAEPAVAVSASASPTGMDIPSAPVREPAPATIIQPKAEEPTKLPGIVNPRKAFGLDESPLKLNEQAASELRKKMDEGRTIIPVPKIKAKKVETAEPVKAEEAKVEAKVEAPVEPKAEEAKPVESVKVKVAGKEMTAEEAAKELEKLIEAQNKAKEQKDEKPEPVNEEEVKATKQQQEKQRNELIESFINERAANNYGLTEDDMDTILSGGKEALDLFSRTIAKSEAETRQWMESSLNPILDSIYRDIEPVLNMQRQVSEYQREAALYQAYPELSNHAQLTRRTWETMQRNYPQEFARATDEEKFAAVAENVRAIMAEIGVPAATAQQPVVAPQTPVAPSPVAPVAQTTAPAPKPRPQPPTGQLGGGRVAGKTNDQASMIQRLIASGK